MTTTTSISQSQQLVVFELGSAPYGLPIERVQEIIRFTKPRRVASEAAWIEGVIGLRGKIIPVCNLAARLGSFHEHADDANIVIVETEAGTAGLIVDGVDEVVTVGPDQLDHAPGASDAAVAGIVKLDDRLVVLLDPVALFAGLDVAVA